MLYLMTNRINIILIILLTIKITPLKATQSKANKSLNGNVEHYGNFTTIEFLKELKHSKPTYESILIMQNQNATISHIFHTPLIEVLNGTYNINGTALTNGKQGIGVLSEMPTKTFVRSLMDKLHVSVVQLNEMQSFNLKRQYNENFLSIVYIDVNIEGIQMTINDHKGLLEKLSGNLLHMRTSKVMLLLNFPWTVKTHKDGVAVVAATIDEDVLHGILTQIFNYCWQQRIINVVAFLADYQITKEFYSYSHMPKFQLEIKSMVSNANDRQEIYPYRLSDLKGLKIPIIMVQKTPRIILYQTREGKEIFGGFVGHFITYFAKKYKCTLVQPLRFEPKKHITEIELEAAVRSEKVEISLGITGARGTFVGFTYPISLLNWCVALPVEPDIPAYKFFTSVFKGETYLLVIGVVIVLSMILSAAYHLHGYRVDFFNVFCHEDCLRGILSQSFCEIANPPMIIRFIYLQICILGILLTTSYLSYFSTYVTCPPKGASLNSFDDVLFSNLKIAMFEHEYNYLMSLPGYKKYLSIFHVVETYQEYVDLRKSFNINYGYGTSNMGWVIIKEQQKLFTTPILRLSPNMCFIKTWPAVFPVQENSIYSALINQLILDTAQSGLLFHWINLGFREMVAANELQLKDLSAKEVFRAMTLDDLRYILIFLGAMFVFVIVVFLAELCVFYSRKIFSSIKSYKCKNKA